jgi:hypothetical protein
MRLKTRTPVTITPQIMELCQGLVPDVRPMRVSVRPIRGARYLECFGNVQEKIKVSGGGIQHGWVIGEWPGIIVEAEFHAIWKDANGAYECVTPRVPRETQILFLPDPVKVYVGIPTPNQRLALRNDGVVQEFIRVATERDEMYCRPDVDPSNAELRCLQLKVDQLVIQLGGGVAPARTPKERAEERKKQRKRRK